MVIDVTIEQLTPYLMDRFTNEAAESIKKGTGPSIKSKTRDPRKEAEQTAYVDENGRLYIPSEHIMGAFRNAGKYHKVGRRQASNLCMAAMSIQQMRISLLDPDTEEPYHLKDIEVDERSIATTYGRQIKFRACVYKYRAKFTIDLEDIFTPDFAYEILADAGKKIGIGSYTPRTSGPFGRFKIVSWTPQTEKRIDKHPCGV